jgi:LacI family transcriptional regulator
MSPITIHDVAKRLNLSITTVSRALDGYDDVSEETRQRVIEVAQVMGYTPNQAARQLRRQRTDTIGYILPAEKPRFADPFFAEFIAGLGDEAAAYNFDLLVTSAPPDTESEQQAYQRWVHGHKVDGLLINRLRLHDWRVQYLSQVGFNFVTLERSLDALDYASVEVDGRRWFKILIDHLVSLGHKRIAYIGAAPELKIQADRFLGYQDGLQAAGLVFDVDLVTEGDLTAEAGYRSAFHLLSLPESPTAITCVDDMTAIGVLHAAHACGRFVGADLAVTGFDGIDGFEHTQPPLTTVNQPVYQIARRMVQMLVNLITGESLHERHAQVEPVLEIRASTVGEFSSAARYDKGVRNG